MSRKRFNPWRFAASNPSLLMLLRELRSALSGCQTVLDIGCGATSPLRFLSGKQLSGVDGYPPAIEEAKRIGTHDDYYLANVLELGKYFGGRRFDACVALDLIEHLHKDDGWRFLETVEKMATQRVVIFTPNGFLPQKSHDGDLQEHLSGWTAEEMRQRGYRVVGMYGPKSLRGEYHRIVRQPRAFWLLVSVVAHQVHTRSHPEKAAAILCIKEVSGQRAAAS